ncbi:MAG: protein translocase subunit SecD, partial [Candidatus Levybacteria bacterium]|nr:protein translocase subunit SecD [Candidatus Levybacteria bacterium]MDZ4228246.1 protein translocase subunit SecD [Candidatus Levybacteria bacterium]
MKKSPRALLWLIILLTIFSILVNLPNLNNLSLGKYKLKLPNFEFKKGLDLAGGTSLTLKADMGGLDQTQREKALEAVKTVIDQRTNYFGVSEPIVQTAISGNDYRVIVELPGVSIDQAK